MSIYRRAAQAKGINNHIYLPESLQEEEEPQLERAATGARPHLARSEGSPNECSKKALVLVIHSGVILVWPVYIQSRFSILWHIHM